MKSCSFGSCSLITVLLFTLCMSQIIRLDPNYKKFVFGTSITREQLFLIIMFALIAYQLFKYFVCNKEK